MSIPYPVREKPFQNYFNHHFTMDTADIKRFEDQFSIKCSRGLHHLIYRFTESPLYRRMNPKVIQIGFKQLSAKNRDDSPEKFQKAFVEACQNGCAEMAEQFIHFPQFKALPKEAISEGLKLAFQGFKQSEALQKVRFAKVLEVLIHSPRCDELSDQELMVIYPISQRIQERCTALWSTKVVLKQLQALSQQGSIKDRASSA
jgi:hypothetical protein